MSFSIDNYLNPYYPSSIVPKLPKPLKRLLGHHEGLHSFNSSWLLYIDILISTFSSVLMIEGVFMNSGIFIRHHSPIIIASYGASAILAFNANTSPLAQPRNILFGHFLSGLVGVIIQKLFALSNTGVEHLYIGGALSVGIASVVMTIFNCVHPPSGASALLPLIDDEIRKMGWWFLPAHLVSSILMISVSCVTNNVFRKYPLYWWTAYKKQKVKDEENDEYRKSIEGSTKTQENMMHTTTQEKDNKVVITMNEVIIPKGVELNDNELKMLNNIKMKLVSSSD